MKIKQYILFLLLLIVTLYGLSTAVYAEEPEITLTKTEARVENAPTGSTLILALYDNSILSGVRLYRGGETIKGVYALDLKDELAGVDFIKAFLWDMSSITPLAGVKGGRISDLPEGETMIDDFKLINGGTFTMGSPDNELEREADEIQHSVTVSSFFMADKEVSQAEYQSVMNDNPSENKGNNLPVTNITWYDAIRYCNALSEKAGLTPCYTIDGTAVTWDKSANGYRLPTEAEWEYAARANTTTPFSFGDYVNDSDANCYNAYGYNNDASGSWVNGYLQHTVDVTDYNKNANGLYNMHGNAAEWVWDWYGEYSTNAQTNPTGSVSGNYKVVRGGGWNDFPKHIRSAYRSAFPADVPLYSIGVRPVRNASAGQGILTSTSNANTNMGTNKTLLVYFSQTNNTKGLAEMIAGMRNIDVFRIERKTPYSGTGNGPVLYGEALTEQRENAVPELKSYLEDEGLNIDDYDTVLLGYCNWWASIPAPVHSFLNRYDLSGKTIIPFCSMGGGRFGQTISAAAKLAPNSTIKKGLEVTYSSYDRDEIESWLSESGIGDNDRTSDKKSMVVYFSYTDNTGKLAKTIADASNSDVYEIIAQEPYTDDILEYYGDNRAYREQNDANSRPAISGRVENMDNYDVIMLGYPIWYGLAPRVVYTFLESYDLSGKTIIPFCTSGSTGISGSLSDIRKLCPNSTVTNGFRGTASMSAEAVMEQLRQNGFEEN